MSSIFTVIEKSIDNNYNLNAYIRGTDIPVYYVYIVSSKSIEKIMLLFTYY